ncbi:MAG: molybdenum cofactor biosynthesis protein MoaE [Conexivisphaerales archaeon]
MDEVDIVTGEIEINRLIDSIKDPECGGLVVFLGTVRNHSEAGRVKELEYEAYEEMAKKKMSEISNQAKEKWPVKKVAILHRKGRLKIGDISVAVGVSSPHRKEAFEACRYIIDSVKGEVPIWKKERLADGGERWVEEEAANRKTKGE